MKTWGQIEFERIPFINWANMKSRKVLRSILVRHVSRVKAIGELALNELSEANIHTEIENLFVDIYIFTGVHFAKQQIDVIKSSGKVLITKDAETLETEWVRRMANFARTRCALKIQRTTRNLFADIENTTKFVFEQVSVEGWGAARAAQEIMNKQGTIDAFRAMRIARTEIVGAQNEGSYMGAGSFGVDVVKSWVATFDGNGRVEHEEMGGRDPIPYNEKFKVPLASGGIDEIDYPGDPSGQPENIIQCRCAVVFEPVNSLIDQLLNE